MAEIFELIFEELLGGLIGGIINNNNIPKPIRYIVVILIVGFITWLAVKIVFWSAAIIGKIIGILLGVCILIAGVSLLAKIFNS